MDSTEEEVQLNLPLSENAESNNADNASPDNIAENNADNNANVKPSSSLGAIPKKTSSTKRLPPSKKPQKLNNNVEEAKLPSNGINENGFTCEKLWNNKEDENHFLTLEDLQTFNLTSETETHQFDVENDFDDFNFHFSTDFHLSDCSNEENELLSISDDGCVYTFKGDHAADLPSSFFSLDIPLQAAQDADVNNRQRTNPSPEMDYLEMDFDPEPSGDADFDIGFNGEREPTLELPNIVTEKICNHDCNELLGLHNEPRPELDASNFKAEKTDENSIFSLSQFQRSNIPQSPNLMLGNKQEEEASVNSHTILKEKIKQLKLPWLHSMNQSNIEVDTPDRVRSYSLTSLNSENFSTSDADVEKRRESRSCPASPTYLRLNTRDKKVMLWTEEEAAEKQVNLVGPSSCGAAAAINVLKALRYQVQVVENSKNLVKIRLRENSNFLHEYLLSRSESGTTHKEMIKEIRKASKEEVFSRNFRMYPPRDFDLACFLRFWMCNDAVPIVTLNHQRCDYQEENIPEDSWCRQMVYGIGSEGVYLTNPLECVNLDRIWLQVTSQPILLIKRENILSRWKDKTGLSKLMKIQDEKFSRFNVVGQVGQVVRESRRELRRGYTNTTHVRLPTVYTSGIIISLKKSNPLYPLLKFCPPLPLLKKPKSRKRNKK